MFHTIFTIDAFEKIHFKRRKKICSQLKHEKKIQKSGSNKVDVRAYYPSVFFWLTNNPKQS